MTLADKNQQAEQQEITDLYARLKQEQPASELDQRILALAKQQLVTSESAFNQVPTLEAKAQSVAKSRWRRWQWPFSIAASVMFVSVIFIDQTSVFMPNSAVFAPQEISEMMPDSVKSSVALDSSNHALLKSDEKAQQGTLVHSLNDDSAEELERRVVVAQQQHVEQANAAPQEMRQKQLLAERSFAEKQKRVSAAESESQVELALLKIAQLQQQLRAKQTQLVALQQQAGIKGTADNFSESTLTRLSPSNLKLTELKVQISELQDSLFSQMRAYNQQVPSWQASDELVSLLSVEQQQAWLSTQSVDQ
jgi:hypothetical protein